MEEHLKKTYGYNKFRSSQKEIITDILEGENVSAVLPTGGGKSMLYQFPATYTDKISLVISPLISLMNDQCLSLEARGIRTLALNGSVTNCRKNISGNCKCSICDIASDTINVSLIYTTPEWLSTKGRNLLQITGKICLIAIDEAHCVSQWSHDFRPSYKKLAIITELFPDIPILTVTATATPNVLEDIYDTLNVDSINEYSLGTRRENLAINVFDTKDNWTSYIKDENTIIYTQTRKETHVICEKLLTQNIACDIYHAGMSDEEREKVHINFLNGKVKVIVATISFGMGIDKSDIRHVINYGVPTDIETYYQEIGRAGRDGLPCRSTIFYEAKDFGMASFLIQKGANDQISRRTESLNLFRQYLSESETCRQYMIDEYFANGCLPKLNIEGKTCGICNNCTGNGCGTLVDIASDIKKLIRVLPNHPLGITKILDLCKNIGHKDYGRILVQILVKYGVIETFSNKWDGGNKQTTMYKKVAKDKWSLKILQDVFMMKIPDKFVKKLQSKDQLFVAARTKVARTYNVTEQNICNDKVLSNISKSKPTTLEELWLIDGVSEEFVGNYGVTFLEYCTESKPKFIGCSADDFICNTKPHSKPKLTHGNTTIDKTMELLYAGKTISDIATIRSIKPMTVEGHISTHWGSSPQDIQLDYIELTLEKVEDILNAIEKTGETNRLRPVMDNTSLQITWVQLKTIINAYQTVGSQELMNIISTK